MYPLDWPLRHKLLATGLLCGIILAALWAARTFFLADVPRELPGLVLVGVSSLGIGIVIGSSLNRRRLQAPIRAKKQSVPAPARPRPRRPS